MAHPYPPGVSPPLGELSSTNQSGLILVMTSMSLCCVLVSLAVRLHMRANSHTWKTEDSITVASSSFSVIQAIIVYYEVHLGLGHLDVLGDPSAGSVTKWNFANGILYVLVLALSKLSIGFLYLYLTQDQIRRGKPSIRIWTIIGLCVLWLVVSILLLLINCAGQDKCLDPYDRWLFIGITDAISEAALVLESVSLVWTLRISLLQKIGVVSIFGARLLGIPVCAIRLFYLNPASLPDNRVLATSLTVTFTQLQIGYVMLAASLPCLKPFIMVYEKNDDRKYSHLSDRPSSTNLNASSAFKFRRSVSVEISELPSPTSPTQPESIYSQKMRVRSGSGGHSFDADKIGVALSPPSKRESFGLSCDEFTFPLESHPHNQYLRDPL